MMKETPEPFEAISCDESRKKRGQERPKISHPGAQSEVKVIAGSRPFALSESVGHMLACGMIDVLLATLGLHQNRSSLARFPHIRSVVGASILDLTRWLRGASARAWLASSSALPAP